MPKIKSGEKIMEQLEEELRKTKEELTIQKWGIEKTLSGMKILVREIEKAKARDEALLESIGEGVAAVDVQGKILFVNHAFEELLGWKQDEVVGKSMMEVIVREDEAGNQVPFEERILSQVLTGKKVTATMPVFYFVRKNKTKFLVDIVVTPVIINNKIVGAIEIFRDITKEKEIDKAKTEFISTVSHELRTPLAITIEGIGLVIDEIIGKINKKQKETLLIAKNNLQRLTSIINNILDISKIEAGKMKINKKLIDIAELIKKVVDDFRAKADKKGLQLRIVLPEKRMNIYVDPDKINQVLVNLINNSIKFTNTGHVEVGVKKFANEIQCYVYDTGIGIANEDLPLAFEKFQQFDRQPESGEKGTGLGLAICKAIVVSHQGKIWIESEKGKWTKVIFTLPKGRIKRTKKINVS